MWPMSGPSTYENNYYGGNVAFWFDEACSISSDAARAMRRMEQLMAWLSHLARCMCHRVHRRAAHLLDGFSPGVYHPPRLPLDTLRPLVLFLGG